MKTQEQVRLTSDVFRTVVDATPDAIAILVDDAIVYVNPAMVALLRAPSAEALHGRRLLDFIAAPFHPVILARIERLRAGEASPLAYEQIIGWDGKVRHVEVAASPVAAAGQTGAAVMMRDIADRLEAERDAQTSRDRAELLARATNDAVWEWDVSTNVVTWNRHSFRALLGWQVDDVQLDWWAERVHADDRERVTESLHRAVREDDVFWSEEYRFQRGDGTFAWILDRGYVVHDESGKSVRMIGSMTDVSELHRAHEERASLQQMLEQAQRVAGLGRVAATMAHEFNNVLMAIQPYAEILRRRASHLPEIERSALQIMHAVKRGKRVTEEILRFTRPSEPMMTRLSLRELLSRFAEQIRELNMPRIEVRFEAPEIDAILEGDAAQLEQVVVNLATNARDAMPVGGVLTIRASDTANVEAKFLSSDELRNYATISVNDTGEGIPPDILAKIFEPLFTTKTRGGTGLGLAVAQQIITSHRGYIVVQSEVGSGTTFHLLLPKVA